ncbi:MAG TPA: ABC transporter permease [Verrucomicrobiae bacterium]|nr:ABC transporter permease [Verrucomicrobiae bacterium]
MLAALRIAARLLARTPGLTITAILLLAIGIGGSTLLFSAFEAIWLRPLAVRHPEQLVRMVQRTPQLGARSYFAHRYYRTLREHATTLSAVFGEAEWTVAMSQPAPAEQLRVRLVTPEFFSELGAHALHGRIFAPEDANAVVISYDFWQRRFQADPGAVGRTIVLHGFPFTIAGVMPREFNGLSADNTPEVRASLAAIDQLARSEGPNSIAPHTRLDELQLDLAGRVKPGVTLRQAEAECLAMWRADVREQYAKNPTGMEFELRRGMSLDRLEFGVSIVRDKFGAAVRLLAAASGVLLLLVCANVAGLVLAGAAARRAEIAIRLALGATRGRLVRQMLAESLLLVAAGAAAGWLLAWIGAPLLARALPPIRDLATTPVAIAIDFHPDARVMLAAFAIALLTAVLIGLVPAISASRTNLDAVLRGVRASQAWRGRSALVVLQVALCTVLLAGAGLLVRTLRELRAADTGLDTAHVVTFTTDPGLMGYTPAQSRALWVNLGARMRDLPGVLHVGAAARPLMRGSGFKTTVGLVGQAPSAADFLNTSINSVAPEYFESMGMRIVRGRGFRAADVGAAKPEPVIVNEAFVRRFLSGVEPIGQLFGTGIGGPIVPDRQVVGVVSDAKYRGLREPMTPTFYSAADSGFSVLCVRTRGTPEALIEPVRRAMAALDPALPFTEIHTLAQETEASVAPERVTATFAAAFGILAALLAAAGIYGLLAFAVEQRRREIGIRMALGARPSQIGTLLGRQTAVMLAFGVAAGTGAALVLTGSLRALLYGVAPRDPLSMAAAAVLMCAVAAAATVIPARRATRVEPAVALREE